jgi:hypothetical protein
MIRNQPRPLLPYIIQAFSHTVASSPSTQGLHPTTVQAAYPEIEANTTINYASNRDLPV